MPTSRRKLVSFLVLLLGGITTLIILKPSGGVFELSIQGRGEDSGRFTETGTKSAPNSRGNLTETVFQNYAEELLRANPQGSKGGVSLPSEKALNTLIDEETSKGFVFEKIFTAKDFRSQKDNSVQGITEYLRALGETEKDPAPEFLAAVASAVANQNYTDLQKFVSQGETKIGDLLQITVPTDLLSFHVGFTNILEKRLELAKAIINIEEDPILGTVALKTVPDTADEELAVLGILKDNLSKYQ